MTEDYSQGKIYMISGNGKIYIGSCTIPLRVRVNLHRSKCRKWKNGESHYVSVYDILGEQEDAPIVLIEDYPCDSKEELRVRERYWIEKYQQDPNHQCVNIKIPTRSKQEHYIENREAKIKRVQDYYHANIERISAHKTEKVECECGALIARRNISSHRKTKKHLENIVANNK